MVIDLDSELAQESNINIQESALKINQSQSEE